MFNNFLMERTGALAPESETEWKPASFVSSRSNRNRQQRIQRIEDLVDSEDGLLGGSLHKKSDYYTSGESALADAEQAVNASDSRLIPGPMPNELLVPSSRPIGLMLLRQMGWREGQGIGPRIRNSTVENMYSQSKELLHSTDGPAAASDLPDGALDEEGYVTVGARCSAAVHPASISSNGYGVGYNTNTVGQHAAGSLALSGGGKNVVRVTGLWSGQSSELPPAGGVSGSGFNICDDEYDAYDNNPIQSSSSMGTKSMTHTAFRGSTLVKGESSWLGQLGNVDTDTSPYAEDAYDSGTVTLGGRTIKSARAHISSQDVLQQLSSSFNKLLTGFVHSSDSSAGLSHVLSPNPIIPPDFEPMHRFACHEVQTHDTDAASTAAVPGRTSRFSKTPLSVAISSAAAIAARARSDDNGSGTSSVRGAEASTGTATALSVLQKTQQQEGICRAPPLTAYAGKYAEMSSAFRSRFVTASDAANSTFVALQPGEMGGLREGGGKVEDGAVEGTAVAGAAPAAGTKVLPLESNRVTSHWAPAPLLSKRWNVKYCVTAIPDDLHKPTDRATTVFDTHVGKYMQSSSTSVTPVVKSSTSSNVYKATPLNKESSTETSVSVVERQESPTPVVVVRPAMSIFQSIFGDDDDNDGSDASDDDQDDDNDGNDDGVLALAAIPTDVIPAGATTGSVRQESVKQAVDVVNDDKCDAHVPHKVIFRRPVKVTHSSSHTTTSDGTTVGAAAVATGDEEDVNVSAVKFPVKTKNKRPVGGVTVSSKKKPKPLQTPKVVANENVEVMTSVSSVDSAASSVQAERTNMADMSSLAAVALASFDQFPPQQSHPQQPPLLSSSFKSSGVQGGGRGRGAVVPAWLQQQQQQSGNSPHHLQQSHQSQQSHPQQSHQSQQLHQSQQSHQSHYKGDMRRIDDSNSRQTGVAAVGRGRGAVVPAWLQQQLEQSIQSTEGVTGQHDDAAESQHTKGKKKDHKHHHKEHKHTSHKNDRSSHKHSHRHRD